MRKLGKDWTKLILITLIFLSSCVGYGSDFKGVLAPEYPTPPSFSMTKMNDGWWMSHSNKVDLHNWIVRVGGYEEDCRATIESMGK